MVTVPMGYTPTQRRSVERRTSPAAPTTSSNMIGVGYVIEQSTETAAKSPAEVDPAALPLCPHDPGRAVRQPGALQPRLRVGHQRHDRHDAERCCRSRSKRPRRQTLESMMSARNADRQRTGQGRALPDRPHQRQRPGAAGRAQHQPERRRRKRRRATSSARRKAKRRSASLAGIPVLVNDSIDVVRPADERWLDRAAGQRCRRPTRRSSPS